MKETTRTAILELQKKYPHKRSALIPALHLAQKEQGFLPLDMQAQVAELFDLDPNEVHAVVTFYDMFYEEPVGKHVIHVCKNLSCMLRGSDELLDGLCQKVGCHPHGTSTDGQFTVIPSECLGACDKAPMMLVDEKVVGPCQIADLDKILQEAS